MSNKRVRSDRPDFSHNDPRPTDNYRKKMALDGVDPAYFRQEETSGDENFEVIKAGLMVFATHKKTEIKRYATSQVALAGAILAPEEKEVLNKALRALKDSSESLRIFCSNYIFSCDAALFAKACDDYKITKPAWLVEFEGRAAAIDNRSGKSDGSDRIGQHESDGKVL